jgi:two-component system OmpR family response regulator
MRILVIDDNTEITNMLSFYLEGQDNVECTVVNDGREALDSIITDNFDVVLLDLAMPEFSGMDVINSLKKENLLEKNNIVILTASALDEQEIQNLLNEGIKSVLTKPISVEELTNTIMQMQGLPGEP